MIDTITIKDLRKIIKQIEADYNVEPVEGDPDYMSAKSGFDVLMGEIKKYRSSVEDKQ